MNYKETIFLPTTKMPMKAGLPAKEGDILSYWEEININNKLSEKNLGSKKFTLHDGPPYANGSIHIGHALGKILKDTINRYHRMNGYHVDFRPGWDCHGLPIEWKIEEEYQKLKKTKTDTATFRQECRDYADKWVKQQSTEFQRIGVAASWHDPYVTMDPTNEAAIVRSFGKMWEKGLIFQGLRPIWWSIAEQTALAEAEIEYQEKTSTELYVSFPVLESDVLPANTAFVAWTTTPWTLPANAGLAINPELKYSLLKDQNNRLFVVLSNTIESFTQKCGLTFEVINNFSGDDLVGTICARPFPPESNNKHENICVYPADFITESQGTGIVHIAPAHGEDDFALTKKSLSEHHKLRGKDIYIAEFKNNFPQIVQKDGSYHPSVSHFGGTHIFKANSAIIEKLSEMGRLLASNDFRHSYPHSWRSKTPLITLLTSQWFVSMDSDLRDGISLRETALRSLHHVSFFPSKSRTRLTSMVSSRPDWCLSRQRLWGVPITIIRHKETGEVPNNQQFITEFINRVANIIEQNGCDAWFTTPLGNICEGMEIDTTQYEKVTDIFDVWFDSGTTFTFALKNNQLPADLYLEGSDQHRGWFQSSLLVGAAILGRAPYKNLITHGFVLDHQGRKMSKSLGNVVSPQEIVNEYGADILRLWAIMSDSSEDLHVQKQLFNHYSDIYRRFRNTIRFLHGNLHNWNDEEFADYSEMPILEKIILHQLKKIDLQWNELKNNFEFSMFYQDLHAFCSTTLSAFYFDIRKDSLYCDDTNSIKRKSARTVLKLLFDCLLKWLAPVLCFTTEEIYLLDNQSGSIHLTDYNSLPNQWLNQDFEPIITQILTLRSVALQKLEIARQNGIIKSSLEAELDLTLTKEEIGTVQLFDLSDIFIVSATTVSLSTSQKCDILVTKSEQDKCHRCWKHEELTAINHPIPNLCSRCASVIG